MDREHRKNIKSGMILNPEWPLNYINRINELRKNHDIVLVFTDFDLMEAFRNLEIPFMIVLPHKARKDEFLLNLKNRGQDDSFCETVKQLWDKSIDVLMNMPEDKLILEQGQYLEDVLLNLGYIK